MINEISELYGRRLIATNLSDQLKNDNRLKFTNGLKINRSWIICKRCGTQTKKRLAKLPNDQYYCPVCIQMGRIDTLNQLVYVEEPNQFEAVLNPITWNGELTPLQLQCSKQITQNFVDGKDHLLWAVTGAGKTEMLFNAINWALENGLRIALASPRVDVCLELFPRIQAAFKSINISLLHGKSTMNYQYCQLTICTTHQLMKFYQAFDVLIIDEVDVFPYTGNSMLHFAVKNALKRNGTKLYLTATPDLDLFRMIKHHTISVSYLPKRFHNHLLPEISLLRQKKLRENINVGSISNKLIKIMRSKVEEKIPFLVFVPHINDLEILKRVLGKYFDRTIFETVFANDQNRLAKVQKMRDHEFKFLITTTILERGVTFPGIDVMVINADSEIFSTSALVQIAGRVGRSIARPTGEVLFIYEHLNKNIRQAQYQINLMNRKAKSI